MRICQSCGRENPDDRDFCWCGEYLRWEPTGFMQAVTPEAAAAAAESAPEPPAPAPPGAEPVAEALAPVPEPAAPSAPAPPAPAAPAPRNESSFETYAPPPPPQPPALQPPAPERAAVTAHEPPPPPPEADNSHGVPAPARAPAPPAAAPGGTLIQGAVPAPPAPAGPGKAAMASITLRLPDGEEVKEEVLAFGVEPGGRECLQALVRNQSGIVDNYELWVRGMADSWWTIYPNTLYLVPFGTGGTYEQQVEIQLHPPRTPEAEARLWDLELVAYSKAYSTEAASARFVLGIRPFEQYETKVKPQRASGRRKVRYQVTVENTANATLEVGFEGTEPDGECTFHFQPGRVDVDPGATAQTTMTVRPPKQIWIGRPLERRLEVKTHTGEEAVVAAEAPEAEGGLLKELGGGAVGAAKGALGEFVRGPQLTGKPGVSGGGVQVGPGGVNLKDPHLRAPRLRGPQLRQRNLQLRQLKMPSGAQAPPPVSGPLLPTQAVFRQQSWLPWWVAVVVPLLAVLAAMLFLLLPKNVTVPDVVGSKSTFAAEKKITEAGLVLNPTQKEQVVKDPKQIGTVLDQTPKAGEKAQKGRTQVSIVVGIGNGKIEVPKIVGLDLAAAEKKLRESSLTLGKSNIQPPDPKAKISSQIPAEREVVKEGTPVDIFYVDPKAAAAAAKGKNKNDGKTRGPADIIVPAIGKQDLDTYATAIGKQKLVPQVVKQFDNSPKGTLFATDPVGGTKVKAGSTVKLLVSAGFPQVAYDNNQDVLLIDAGSGRKLGPIAHGSTVEKDPTWSFDGTQVAYQAGGQVFLKNMLKPEQAAIELTQPGDSFRDLAWAPTGNANVLAMLRVPPEDKALNELCFGVTGQGMSAPRCLAGPKDVEMERSIRWAPDGTSVLVFGRKVGQTGANTGAVGMLRFTTKHPFSPDPKDWKAPNRFQTDVQFNKGVLDAAISPDGEQMAVVSNFNTQGEFRLSLAKRNDFLLGSAKNLDVTACKVIWRPDGKELLVVQASDCAKAETGALVRVPLGDPRQQRQLTLIGDNPSYQPP